MWSIGRSKVSSPCVTGVRCPPKRIQIRVWASSSDLVGPTRPNAPTAPARAPPPGPPGLSRPPGGQGPPGRGQGAGPPQGGRGLGGPGRGSYGRGSYAPRGGPYSGPGRGGGPGRSSQSYEDRQGGRGGRGRGRGFVEEPDDGIIMNRRIPFETVRVLNKMKEMVGIMSLSEALELAENTSDDLLLLNENADPPLVRICALSKYRYEQEKAKKDQSKKQRDAQQTLKELKMTPRTDVHDFEVKVKQAHNFLSKGDKVKVMIQFKGREVAGMKTTAAEMVDKLIAEVDSIATVESAPRMAGNTMTVMLTPKRD